MKIDYRKNIAGNEILNNILHAVLLMQFVILPEAGLKAQGVSSGSRIIVHAEAFMTVKGNVQVHAPFLLDGTMYLAGHLTDNHGLISTKGQLNFCGTTYHQYINGSALTILHDMEIVEGSEVHLSSHKKLTVKGLLHNHNAVGGIVLHSDEYGTASLLHYSPSVSGVVQRYFINGMAGYVQLSSPVIDHPIEPEFYRPGDLFFSWYEPFVTHISFCNQIYYPTFLDTNQDSENFLSASGYFVRYPNIGTGDNLKSFDGQFHQGEVGFILSRKAPDDLDYTGYNLMGNPYPSAIDWLAEEGWTGKEHLVGQDKGIAWVWNQKLQNFGVIHPSSRSRFHNRVRGIIPSTAGFFVQAASGSDGEMLLMDDRVRVHDQTGLENRQEEKELPQNVLRIKVKCLQKGYIDEVILEYGHESLMTARKMFSPNPESPQIFVYKDDEKYSLLLLPDKHNVSRHSVWVKTPENGQFSLAITGSDLNPLVEIINNQTNKRIALLVEESIIFDGRDSHLLEISVSLRL